MLYMCQNRELPLYDPMTPVHDYSMFLACDSQFFFFLVTACVSQSSCVGVRN